MAAVERDRLFLQAGLGIADDCHARVGSPRQVLMVDWPTLARFGLAPGALGENLLIDQSLSELKSGKIVRIGGALIRPTFLCEPCAQLNRVRPGLAAQMKGQRGWLGMVVQGGAIAPGDAITPTEFVLPAMADLVRTRFHDFVARIPGGRVVSTANLMLALGTARAYYRAIPTFLRHAPVDSPVHRVVARDGRLFSRYLPDQAARLQAEGISLQAEQVPEIYYWPADCFHPLEMERSHKPVK